MIANPLSDIRAGYLNELEDPMVQQRLYALTHREVGSQGPSAQQAFIETLFNRAASRNKTLAETIADSNYYPAASLRGVALKPEDLSRYRQISMDVARGSNVSNYATGNASGRVGFGGGPQTFAAAGERFGIEKADLRWAQSLRGSPQTQQVLPTPTGLPGPGNLYAGGVTPPTQFQTDLAAGIKTGTQQLGQGIMKQAGAQQESAINAMAQARASVPITSPLLQQLAEDPLAALRAAGLI